MLYYTMLYNTMLYYIILFRSSKYLQQRKDVPTPANRAVFRFKHLQQRNTSPPRSQPPDKCCLLFRNGQFPREA